MSLRDLMTDAGDYYPGSREKRAPNPVVPEEPERPDLPEGKWLLINGIKVEFFGIGELARVLNRKPVTIRMWESEGIIPTSGYSMPGKDRDARGRRRLWTRAQIEGVWLIAKEEGVLEPGPRINVKATQFTDRVRALFRELR